MHLVLQQKAPCMELAHGALYSHRLACIFLLVWEKASLLTLKFLTDFRKQGIEESFFRMREGGETSPEKLDWNSYSF